MIIVHLFNKTYSLNTQYSYLRIEVMYFIQNDNLTAEQE